MKKLVSMLITGILLLSLMPNIVFAYENDRRDSITLIESTDGVWKIADQSFQIQQMNNNSITVQSFENYDNIYSAEDTQYFQQVTEDTFIEVEPIRTKLSDYDSITNLKQYGIPEEMYHDILEMQEKIELNDGNENAEVIFFVGVEQNEYSRLKEPNTMPDEVIEWEGKTFVNRVCYFENLKTGSNRFDDITWTEAIAYSATEIAFYTEPFKDLAEFFSIIDSFESIASWWKNASGHNTITGNGDSYLEVNLTYNLALQYTYLVMPDREYLGCASQRIRVLRVQGEAYFFDGAEGFDEPFDYTCNYEYRTENYDDPVPVANDHYLATHAEEIRSEIPLEDANGEKFSAELNIETPSFEWPSDWPEP